MSKSTLVSRILRSRAGAGILVGAPLAAAAVAVATTLPSSPATEDAASPTDRQSFSSEGRTYTPPASSGSSGSAGSGRQVESLPDVPASTGGFSGMVGSSTGSPSVPLPWLPDHDVPAYAGPNATAGDSSLVSGGQDAPHARTRTAPPADAPAAPVARTPERPAPETPRPPVTRNPVAPKPPVTPVTPAPEKPIVPPVRVPVTPPLPDTSYVAPEVILSDGTTCRVEGDKVYLNYVLVLTGDRFVASDPFVSTEPGQWAGELEAAFDVPADAITIPVTFPVVVVQDLSGVSRDVAGPASFELPLSVCSTGPLVESPEANQDLPVEETPGTGDVLDPNTDVPVETDLDLIYQQLVEEYASR